MAVLSISAVKREFRDNNYVTRCFGCVRSAL